MAHGEKMNTETWEQRRDRLAEERRKDTEKVSHPLHGSIAAQNYRLGYDQGRADLLECAKSLEHIAELILKEWEEPTDGVLKGELITRLSQYSHDAREILKAWRKETEGEG
jgi:hypothetical protein